MGGFQRRAEKDHHQYFQLSTRNLFWKLKTWVAASRSGLEIPRWRWPPSQGASASYRLRKVSHPRRPGPQTSPERWQALR